MLCQVFPEQYDQQLAAKVTRFTSLGAFIPEPEVFASPPTHYRFRAEFRIWHEGDDTFYIMFDTETKEKVRVDACPMASHAIDELMPRLMAEIKKQPVLRTKLFQVDFLSTLSGEMLVTLIYRKSIKDDAEWHMAAKALKLQLPVNSVIGRARKEKVCLSRDYVMEALSVDGHTLHFQQIENSFTQPNAWVAEKMLHWARTVSGQNPHDLIELYCGNGHFSIALADCYRRILATEISKTSVKSAQLNIEKNGVENLTVVKMAAEEISDALQGGRDYTRLKDIALETYEFKTILVDPPRAGLDDLTRQMVTQFDRILYISCNPDTLKRDLEVITQTHEVQACALFDQFPYTPHIESGVFLTRKES